MQALRDTLQQAFSEPLDDPSTHVHDDFEIENREQHQEHYLEHFTKNAMACQFELMFNLHQYPQAADSTLKAFELIDQLEARLTVYRDESEVSQLNRNLDRAPIPVSRHVGDLLSLSLKISEATDGAFDITSSLLTSLWGFDRRAGTLPTPEAIELALNSVGYGNIQLDSELGTVTLPPNCEINFGGIGKGYALDEVAKLMQAESIEHWVLHGGQSSVVARGNNFESDRTDNGWTIGLSHPTLPDYRIGEVTLRDQALGTSGTARQSFIHQGQRYGHIIDPRTGWPTSHCLSTTVISPSAAVCDALATAFFVMQPEQVESYCRDHLDVSAILVLPADRNEGLQKVELVWFNLDENDFTLS